MKYAILYASSFIKIGSRIQKSIGVGEFTDTHTYGDLISLLSFFSKRILLNGLENRKQGKVVLVHN
jgi:hypothetical protein